MATLLSNPGVEQGSQPLHDRGGFPASAAAMHWGWTSLSGYEAATRHCLEHCTDRAAHRMSHHHQYRVSREAV